VRNDLIGTKGGGLDETWGLEAQKGKTRGRGIDNDRVCSMAFRMGVPDTVTDQSLTVPHCCRPVHTRIKQFWSLMI